jgi:hypothetical protein
MAHSPGHNVFSPLGQNWRIMFLAGLLLKMVKRTNLTVNDHHNLKDFLLERVENGQFRRGSITQGACGFGVH